MSKKYVLKHGDTARDLEVTFYEDGVELTAPPDSVVMKLTLPDGEVIGRDLTGEGATWNHRFTDEDFEVLPAGAYPTEFELTFSDGSEVTIPTKGTNTIVIGNRMIVTP
jgi:hypothetical protein